MRLIVICRPNIVLLIGAIKLSDESVNGCLRPVIVRFAVIDIL